MTKTNELTGAALDWAVHYAIHGEYSTNWAQGGPIIEREKIALIPPNERIDEWEAVHPDRMHNEEYGPTPLIAAMRCFVASKLGDEVDVPKELTC